LKHLLGYWPLPVGLIIGSVIIIFIVTISPTNPDAAKIAFVLQKDETARSVAQRLKQEKFIDNPTKFIVLAKLLNYERSLKKGKFFLPQEIDELTALRILVKGGQASALVTIPEGKTLEQTAEILQEYQICSKTEFLASAQNPSLLATLGIKAKSAEGYLFPDSYEFEIFTNPKDVLTRLINQFFFVFNSLLSDDSVGDAKNRDKTKGILKDHEIVILASIIEAEAQLNKERPIIASVFLNRLKRRLPLQSCATIEYILKERKPILTIQDLKINSPYNTYLHRGLPPGPICSSGRSSLKAAMFPGKTDYLFFVSRGDGSHQFSKTSRDHFRASRRHQTR